MARWEYRTLSIGYDKKKQKNWVLERGDGGALIGLPAILEAYGSDGWELVSLDADRSEVFPGFGKWYMEPAAYRATFKRAVG
ncbi:MAG: hypothetical protein E3J64_07105 [Anaerolineales bacterium]|nr:MAG: hypothetical protein E3J64_07105 [Anaerolineales bacterium]